MNHLRKGTTNKPDSPKLENQHDCLELEHDLTMSCPQKQTADKQPSQMLQGKCNINIPSRKQHLKHIQMKPCNFKRAP